MARNWYLNSNYLIFLSVEDEAELLKYLDKAEERGIQVSAFREPDMNNELTAIALEPSELTRKLVSNLPLALRERRVA